MSAGLLLSYVLAGLWVYDDYGLSTDELTQRRHGQVSTRYIFELADVQPFATQLKYVHDLETYRWRNYGVAFQLPLTVFEVINDLSFPTILLYRHYVNFLFFVVGVLAFYRLATESLGHWLYGAAGTLFFILMPRIFAESFYNPKDTIFLAAFTVALYFGFRYWRSKSIVMGGFFGVTAAFAMNIRIVAVGLVALVIAMVLFDLWQAGASFFNTRSRLQKLSVLVLMLCLVGNAYAVSACFVVKSCSTSD